MRFKAELSASGLSWLESKFVPTLEKLGKEVYVLLVPSALYLVQDQAVAGVEVHADLLKAEIFEEYTVTSQNANKIAFRLASRPLLAVLRSVGGSARVILRLVKRSHDDGRQYAYLNFHCTGELPSSTDVRQDLPLLSNPLARSEVEELERIISSRTHIDYWLQMDRLRLSTLEKALERIHPASHSVDLFMTPAGLLLFKSADSTSPVVMGMEYRGLRVWPREKDLYSPHEDSGRTWAAADDDALDTQALQESRIEQARNSGHLTKVTIAAKDLSKALKLQHTQPDDAMMGIPASNAFVELAFRYESKTDEAAQIGVGVKVPTCEPDDPT
jgi:hypothetical protein